MKYELKVRQICFFIIAFLPVTKFFMLSSILSLKAREDMWIGVLPFHAIIEEMVDNIDYYKANEELLSKIYGNIDYSIDYAENAFLLAAYMLGKKECDEIKLNKPKIKKLSSTSFSRLGFL